MTVSRANNTDKMGSPSLPGSKRQDTDFSPPSHKSCILRTSAQSCSVKSSRPSCTAVSRATEVNTSGNKAVNSAGKSPPPANAYGLSAKPTNGFPAAAVVAEAASASANFTVQRTREFVLSSIARPSPAIATLRVNNSANGSESPSCSMSFASGGSPKGSGSATDAFVCNAAACFRWVMPRAVTIADTSLPASHSR